MFSYFRYHITVWLIGNSDKTIVKFILEKNMNGIVNIIFTHSSGIFQRYLLGFFVMPKWTRFACVRANKSKKTAILIFKTNAANKSLITNNTNYIQIFRWICKFPILVLRFVNCFSIIINVKCTLFMRKLKKRRFIFWFLRERFRTTRNKCDTIRVCFNQ